MMFWLSLFISISFIDILTSTIVLLSSLGACCGKYLIALSAACKTWCFIDKLPRLNIFGTITPAISISVPWYRQYLYLSLDTLPGVYILHLLTKGISLISILWFSAILIRLSPISVIRASIINMNYVLKWNTIFIHIPYESYILIEKLAHIC